VPWKVSKTAACSVRLPTDALAAEAWNHHMQWLIMGITIVILIVLFSVQFLGTAKMGRFFGPITGLWFVSLGALGASHLISGPEILAAFNPWHGWHFLTTGGHAASSSSAASSSP
jgi:KUP system potassium uptake protein